MASPPLLDCPLCPFADNDPYILMLHVETIHSEAGEDSPFLVREGTSPGQDGVLSHLEHAAPDSLLQQSCKGDATEDQYVECPEPDCGESILVTELNLHSDMHLAEQLTVEGMEEWAETDDVAEARRVSKRVKTVHGHPAVGEGSDDENVRPSGNGQKRQVGRKGLVTRKTDLVQEVGSGVVKPAYKRLGKSELGPHAYEKQMPTWLRHQILAGGSVTTRSQLLPDGTLEKIVSVSNETAGLIPLLAQLSEQDPTVERAYFCAPDVRHIFKMSREGGFCGYRNIQMLISHIREVKGTAGHETFREGIPHIIELQDLIEKAWDRGFNPSGRIETGGIRGTRKYIGTPEAQALFLSLGIPCEARAYARSKDLNLPAYRFLLEAVQADFAASPSLPRSPGSKVHRTSLPPIYLQHPGHSLTVVGLETRVHSTECIRTTNLLVFDPMFRTSPGISKLLSPPNSPVKKRVVSRAPGELLRAYRRGPVYLRRFAAYETLSLVGRVDRAAERNGMAL